MGGDFNLITSLQEKKGGIRRLEPNNVTLKKNIDKLSLVDIPNNSGMYIWSNKRVWGSHQIVTRLGCFLNSKRKI
jgi:hypothetical protein